MRTKNAEGKRWKDSHQVENRDYLRRGGTKPRLELEIGGGFSLICKDFTQKMYLYITCIFKN